MNGDFARHGSKGGGTASAGGLAAAERAAAAEPAHCSLGCSIARPRAYEAWPVCLSALKQESRDACELLERRLQEGAAALAEAAAALQSREAREADAQVRRGRRPRVARARWWVCVCVCCRR